MNEIQLRTEQENSDAYILSSRPIALNTNQGMPVRVIRIVFVREIDTGPARVISLFITGLVYTIIVQSIYLAWMKAHSKSCEFATASVLFLFPLIITIMRPNCLFLGVYAIFALFIANIMLTCLKRPVRKNMPQKTYKKFAAVFRISKIGALVGIISLFYGFFRNNTRFIGPGLLFMFVSLYFGMLTRETIKFVSEKMTVNIGYYSKEGIPGKQIEKNICALCGSPHEESNDTHKLKCGHYFHRDCIKGWLFLGKKSFCPCCRENVEISGIQLDFWENNLNIYTNLIDALRKVIVVISFVFLVAFFTKYTKLQ